ncbi:serine hydrolase domain-containing protein [Gorillibacterium sp. sgz5001074]|uniref:serine hydrolase domain-containing protein n=1 Tax=Gorillibacterium sp. sgz5001074 TaxID=3446695 RepID=UPI003F661C24
MISVSDSDRGLDWERTHPSELGWIGDLEERTDRYAASKLPKLLGFLLAAQGCLVMERYYNGADGNTLMDVRSVTKSFTGAAVGMAINDGLLEGTACRVGEYLAEDAAASGSSVSDLTLFELLSMTSGLYWKTGNKLGEAYLGRWHKSKDWLRFILRLPVDPEMRGRFLYRSPDSHLLSCLMTRVTGKPTSIYLKERLFDPIGIEGYEWAEDPQGNTAGHVFLKMKSRDLLRFGQLILNGGRWGKESVLPEPWIRESHNPRSEGLPGFGQYGYQWWIKPVAGVRAVYAWGHGGNFIMLLPELDSVAVAVSDPSVNRWRDPRTLMEQVIIPGMKRNPALGMES